MDSYFTVFLAVVEHKSFTKAANALHMTQPAVSQTIRNLEEKLGATLIERKHKNFYLNQAGNIVYTYAKEMVAKYEHMNHLVTELKEEATGNLVIGASYTIGEYIVPDILKLLHQKYPSIQPHVFIGNTQTIVEKLTCHEIDIALVEGMVNEPNLQSKPFMTDEMHIIAGVGKELNIEPITSIADLSAYTWIIRESGSGTRKLTEKLLQQHKVEPKQLYTFGSTQIIKETVESGLGISLLSKASIKKELQLGIIQIIPVKETPVKRNFFVVKRDQTFQTKTIQVFENIIYTYHYD